MLVLSMDQEASEKTTIFVRVIQEKKLTLISIFFNMTNEQINNEFK